MTHKYFVRVLFLTSAEVYSQGQAEAVLESETGGTCETSIEVWCAQPVTEGKIHSKAFSEAIKYLGNIDGANREVYVVDGTDHAGAAYEILILVDHTELARKLCSFLADDNKPGVRAIGHGLHYAGALCGVSKDLMKATYLRVTRQCPGNERLLESWWDQIGEWLG
jgi:hypothetical protein